MPPFFRNIAESVRGVPCFIIEPQECELKITNIAEPIPNTIGALPELSLTSTCPGFDDSGSDKVRFLGIIGFAAAHANNVELLDWIYAHFTEPEHRKISADHFAGLVDRGNLEAVCWIHDHGFEFPESMMDGAAGLGNLELVQFLYEHGGRTSGGCLRQAMGLAAEFGHLEVTEFLHQNYPNASLLDEAAIVTIRTHSDTSTRANTEHANHTLYFLLRRMAISAASSLRTSTTFHVYTSKVMTDAAIQGHFDIVRYFHENRSEGCTVAALQSGPWRVLWYLKRHRPMKKPGIFVQLLRFMERLVRSEISSKAAETYYEYCARKSPQRSIRILIECTATFEERKRPKNAHLPTQGTQRIV